MLDLTNGYIDISDPGYSIDDVGRFNNIKIKPGKYISNITKRNLGIFGERIQELKIIHEDFNEEKIRWLRYGEVSVDSGLLGIYKSPSKEYDNSEWIRFVNTLPNLVALEEQHQVITSTGLGDGYYTVYVIKQNKQIIGVKVKFL